MTKALGIIGTGVYLPDEVRKNDWWPRESVATWPDRVVALLNKVRNGQAGFELTPGVRKVIDEFDKVRGQDPFLGISERRVMPEGMVSSDMEQRAARDAITAAGIDPQQIGAVMVHAMVPDFHTFNQAAVVHNALGLSDRCICVNADSVCNSFPVQLELAAPRVNHKDRPYTLLVQSSAVSRFVDPTDWFSAFMGDGATAAVVGPVSDGHGLLTTAHRVDTANARALVTGVPGKQWYDDGRTVAQIFDKAAARRMMFHVPDRGVELLGDCFAATGLKPEQVDFFACNQASGNMRRLTQELVGMNRARFLDSLRFAGTLNSGNAPLQLHLAAKEGLLADGSLVAMYTWGNGTTSSAVLLRWGR